MSILIISLPRTGSTSLLYKLANERGLIPLFEPFDGTNRFRYNGENNIIVKTIVPHHIDNLKLSEEFDEVILLSRRNLLECAESHAYQTYFSKTKNYNSNTQYYYEDVPIDIFELCYIDIIKWDNKLVELSDVLHIPITYYEDIYDMSSKDRLRLGNKNNLKKSLI
jgi:hypothetical protein